MVRADGLVHITRVNQGQEVVRCGLTPEIGARATEIPRWMFDAGVCGLMKLAVDPSVCVEALRDLKALLKHARHPADATAEALQAEHRDLSSAGGAHAIRSEVAAMGDATVAVPADSQRAELGRGTAGSSAPGVAAARAPAARAPRAVRRRAGAAGGSR
jgi:hypothetical protein